MKRNLTVVALAASLLTACADDSGTTDPCIDLQPGNACTWLGLKGEEGHNGDGLARWDTQVNQVQDMVFLADGTAVFSDFNNYLVRKVVADGTVDSMVGWTDPVFPGDGPIGGIPAGGAAGEDWRLNHPTNLLVADDGTIVLVAWHNHKVLDIDPDTNWVTIRAGTGAAGFLGDGGPALSCRFLQPNDACFDDAGNLYVVDQQNQRVRKIGTDGIIDTIAGDGNIGYVDGDALSAEFWWEKGSNPNPSGGIACGDNVLYIADTLNNVVRVMDLSTNMVSTLAGTGEAGFSGDGGPASAAQLAAPRDLEIGPDGDLYIADTDNGAVRAINLSSGTIRTVVGTGELGLDEEEQLPATETHLRRPFGVAFDAAGDLYVMDTLNSRIVKVAR